MKRLWLIFAQTVTICVAALFTGGCAKDASGPDGRALTVYTPTGLADWYDKQFEKFTGETGIKITVFEASG